MAFAPLSVSDMLKLLEAVPGWKTLTTLPKRIAELEARVAVLEGRPTRTSAACPICGEAMKVTAVKPDHTFGEMGVQRHSLSCDACGHQEERQVDP